MQYYQDITLLSDAEVSLGFIWEKVYQQIHLLLVKNKCAENQSQIGLSFPSYGDKAFPLGYQLRLLAENEEQLIQANINQWLQRLSDYVHIKSIKVVPNEVNEFECFYRVNPKSQQRRIKQLDRRVAVLVQKHGVTEEDMRTQLLASIEQRSGESKLPYINIQSLSSATNDQRHKFMLFINCDKSAEPKAKGNVFTCYGLSPTEQGTTPVFVPCF